MAWSLGVFATSSTLAPGAAAMTSPGETQAGTAGFLTPGAVLRMVSTERVKHQSGEPEKVIEEGRQTILSSVGGSRIDDRPPVYPGDVQFGWTKAQVEKVYHQPRKVFR